MNIIDLLCKRLGLAGRGRYTALGKLFGVSRQHVNGWRLRDSVPKAHFRRALELGLTLEELTTPAGCASPSSQGVYAPNFDSEGLGGIRSPGTGSSGF